MSLQNLKNLTTTNFCQDWDSICDKVDIFIKDGKVPEWEKKVIEYMRRNYFAKKTEDSELNQKLLEANTRFNCSLADVINQIIPSRPEIQKGDLGEAVCCLCFEELFSLTVPYYKWANKNHPDMSEPGVDVLAFDLKSNAEDDIMYVIEAKWRKDTVGLKYAIKKKKTGVIANFNRLSDRKLCTELNLLLKKIENDEKLSKRISNFYLRFTKKPREVYNATFFLIDSDVDIDPCLKLLTAVSKKHRPMKAYNKILDNLEPITYKIFRGIKDWNKKV